MPPWLFDTVRLVVFLGGGVLVSRWLMIRPIDFPPPEPVDLRADPEQIFHSPDRRMAPHTGAKIFALWVWLVIISAAGCTIGSENARRDLATMPTPMALRELREEREQLRIRYGDAFIESEMQHWRERQ